MKKKNLREKRERLRQEENRRSILQAAEKVFIKKGYRLATVDDIADEAQFSKATLYRYFKSKSDIVFEIIYSSFEESCAGIQKIQMEALSAEKKLKKMIDFIISIYHKKKNLARMIFMEKTAMKKLMKKNSSFHGPPQEFHPKISPRLESKMKQISDLMSEIIQEGVKTGEFRDMDVHDASVVLAALIRGFYFRGPLQEKQYSIQETTELIHTFFLNGIKRIDKAQKGV